MSTAIPIHRAAISSGGAPSWVPRLDGIAADLLFDFAGRRAWQGGRPATDASLVSVTRATTTAYGRNAAGVYVPYSANTIRYDDVLGGALIEPSGTNLCLQSSSLDSVTWTKPADVTITANSTTGVFGTATADTVTCDGTGGGGLFQTITVSASTTYTWSFFAKLGTLSASDYKFAVYDVTNAAFIGLNLVPSTLPTTAGWTLVSYTFTTPALCVLIRVYPLRNSSAISGTVYVDHCQLEAGTFATSPIPTTTAAAARAADRLVYDQTDDYGPGGTMLIDWVGASAAHYAQTTVPGGLANASAPAFADTIYASVPAGGANATLSILRSSVAQASVANRVPLAGSLNKYCAAWQSGRAVRALNGQIDIATGLLGVPAAAQNRIVVGSGPWASGNYIGYVIKRAAFWKSTRSDAAVQGVTV